MFSDRYYLAYSDLVPYNQIIKIVSISTITSM